VQTSHLRAQRDCVCAASDVVDKGAIRVGGVGRQTGSLSEVSGD